MGGCDGLAKVLVAELLIALPPETFRWDGAQLWPKERFARWSLALLSISPSGYFVDG